MRQLHARSGRLSYLFSWSNSSISPSSSSAPDEYKPQQPAQCRLQYALPRMHHATTARGRSPLSPDSKAQPPKQHLQSAILLPLTYLSPFSAGSFNTVKKNPVYMLIIPHTTPTRQPLFLHSFCFNIFSFQEYIMSDEQSTGVAVYRQPFVRHLVYVMIKRLIHANKP